MTTVGKWWEKLPHRFLFEVQKVNEAQKESENLLKNLKWIELASGQLSIQGEIVIADKVKTFELIFPFFYPAECPTIYPLPRGEKWSTHQFGGSGALCLEYGPDNWEPQFSAAELIRSLIKLLISEKFVEEKIISPQVIPSRHEVTLADQLRGKYYRFLLIDDFQKLISRLGGIFKWKTIFIWAKESCTIIPTEIPLGLIAGSAIPKTLHSKGRAHEGLAFRLGEDCEVDLLRSVKDIKDLNLVLEKLSNLGIKIGESEGFKKEQTEDFTPLLLISKNNNFAVFLLRNTPKDGLCLKEVGSINADFASMLSRISKEEYEVLKSKRVGIIGLGSAGSKIAVSLARTGINKFVLIDDDIFLPENIARNELNALSVGGFKVEQIEEAMEAVSVSSEIKKHNLKIGEQCNTAIHENALKDLRDCDLIIECTANPSSFLISSMISSQSRIPLIWCEIFGGGLGGIVARSSPIQDPCPLCVRRILLNHLSNYPPAPGKPDQSYGLEIEGNKIIIASDSDVAFASSITCQVAIACLASDPLLTSEESIILFGLKKEWIFDHPFHVIKLMANKELYSCKDCWKAFPEEAELSDSDKKAFNDILMSIKKND